MVRAPAKSCPNLSRLFDDAGPDLLSAFLKSKPFARLVWLAAYTFDVQDSDGPKKAAVMLQKENKERLGPLEDESARVITIASDRGEYVLEGLAVAKLAPERARLLLGQRDKIARSLWAYVNEHGLFEAAENTLHLQLYRRYDKHYQTFAASPSIDGGPASGSAVLSELLEDLSKRLDRGEGYSIDKYDIPADGDEPAAEMYLLFHPDRPTSVREIDEFGNRSSIYFRPPGEAMIVYTPTTGRVHVRAGSRALRNVVAERFIETALGQPYSSQPVDFQAYDISRFFKGFELETPDFEDFVIECAKVIRADISVNNLANRLSLSTTVKQDLTELIASQPGLPKIFERAVAVRSVEIAVQYRRPSKRELQTLNFSLTDRNTSSLLSIDDPSERVLGHRLLRHWKILRDGRAPSEAEAVQLIPSLLALWDIGAEKISGAWLMDRGIDAQLLIDLGFLVPAGLDGDDLIDEDDIGLTDAAVVVRVEEDDNGNPSRIAEHEIADEVTTSAGNPDRYRVYRVRDGWVEQHLKGRLEHVLDAPAIQKITDHLYSLGTLNVDGTNVPLYLARGLDQEKVRSSVDTGLRARSNLGVGLVVQAGSGEVSCIAANVLAPLSDQIDCSQPQITLVAEKLRSAYRLNRVLARGGMTVELVRKGNEVAILCVPGKGSIDINGSNRIEVIQKLVDAHNSGPVPMATRDLIQGVAEDQSLANIFKQPLWNKLKADFLRSRGPKGPWEIAT